MELIQAQNNKEAVPCVYIGNCGKMSVEKEKIAYESPKKAGKILKPLFETKKHKKAEREYEEYYNRIRIMSRGGV